MRNLGVRGGLSETKSRCSWPRRVPHVAGKAPLQARIFESCRADPVAQKRFGCHDYASWT